MMLQFYIHQLKGCHKYLCLRDTNNPWYGVQIKRLD
jgi:hypothetical protein